MTADDRRAPCASADPGGAEAQNQDCELRPPESQSRLPPNVLKYVASSLPRRAKNMLFVVECLSADKE